MQGHRIVAALSLAAAAALAGCGSSESPAPKPPPQAAAPAPVPVPPAAPAVDAELSRLAAEVYVYAYPLVLSDVTRETRTAGVGPNAFVHRRTLPDASAPGPDPNADFLYSEAWLDLSQGPVTLAVPDVKGRYYLVAMLDAWSNVAGSLGTRATGSEKARIAIVGPGWKGTLPAGVLEVRAPTDMAWLLARTEVRGAADVAAAAKVQEQLKLSAPPPAKRGKGEASPAAAAADAKSSPRDVVASMDAATFLTRFGRLLKGNPPSKEDAPMAAKIGKLGVVAGQPFDAAKLEPLAARSVDQGMATAREAILGATRTIGSADIRNGWMFDQDVGRWGTDYGKRAVAAWKGLGINAPEDAVFLSTFLDAGGRRLDGRQKYVLHFDAGKTPPAEGFWSVSLYDEQKRFVANPLGRFHLGSNDRLKPNPDGSVDIVLQATDPGPDRAANWLPTPQGPFNLMLRIYWPKSAVIGSQWLPPGVRPAT
jgi:hypothetical protein